MRLTIRWSLFAAAGTSVLLVAGCPTPRRYGASVDSYGVNRLIVSLHGTGARGFAVVVNTLREEGESVRRVREEGAFVFRLYATDRSGQPILDRPVGEWSFDEAVTREHWSPGGWGGEATFAFLLLWQSGVPAPGTTLVLVTQFTPRGRAPVMGRPLPFTVQGPARPETQPSRPTS